MAELAKAKQTKTILKSNLTRFETFLNGFDITKTDIKYLCKRKDNIENSFNEFISIQNEIAILEDKTANEEEIERFEHLYCTLMAQVEHLIIDNTPRTSSADTHRSSPSNNSASYSSNSNTNQQFRLPKIEIPKFSGSFDQWMPFKSSFISIIHDNESISDLQKLHYLISSLQGDATEVLHSFEIKGENYNEAWDLLVERFDNKRRIVHNHIKAIYDIPSIIKESSVGLRKIVDGVLKHTRALKLLKRSADHWDDLLIYIISTKLDPATNKDWEDSLNKDTLPTLKDMTSFLIHKCDTLDMTSKKPLHEKSSVHFVNTDNNSFATSQCNICKGTHRTTDCEVLKRLPIEKRIEKIKSLGLCMNCLKTSNHPVFKCFAGACRICRKKHHTILHQDQPQSSSSNNNFENRSNTPTEKTPSNQPTSSNAAICETKALLSTALVDIADRDGRMHECRALLDCGSQSSFITESLSKHLNLNLEDSNIVISGILNEKSRGNKCTIVNIASKMNKYKSTLNCIVVPTITATLPHKYVDIQHIVLPRNIRLADPKFNIPQPVDLLIGADLFWELLCIGQISKTSNRPCLHKTQLGWVLASNIPNHKQNNTSCNLSLNQQLHKEKLWKIEADVEEESLSVDEKWCEQHFLDTYRREADGRFVVKLPSIPRDLPTLGDSRHMAERFYSLENKLNHNKSLKIGYSKCIQEYLDLHHMIEATDKETDSLHFYLPHHVIIKSDSVTTKLRVVFDASTKSTSSASLNDLLMVGSTTHQDLFSILLRFRTYALAADVTKMYRQMLVDSSQTSLQRILWRNNSSEPIRTYELQTITYGTAPASFLAIRCMHQLAIDAQDEFPIASAVIRRDFYVDDLLTGANTKEEITVLRDKDNIIQILKRGMLELNKWNSNNSSLLSNIPDISSGVNIYLTSNEVNKTLGLLCNTSSDQLQYKVPEMNRSKISKSRIAPLNRIFSDANDYSFFTPFHFLIGDSLTAIIEPNLTEVKFNHMSRWQTIQFIKQHFWKRWTSEYLSQLQERSKWRTSSQQDLLGQLALIREEIQPSLHWTCGRIIDAHPGADGIIRLATVKTADGSTYRRSTAKLCVLPLRDQCKCYVSASAA